MLNPIRNLKGKLNHLRFPSVQLLATVQLANSISPASSTVFAQTSLQKIRTLKTPTAPLSLRLFHKFLFDLQVHSQNASLSLPSTIYDQLSPHERKVSHLFTRFASGLSLRQQLFLNLALRRRLNNEFAGWKRLHLSPESPFKAELQIVPTLLAGSRVGELKVLQKKGVMKEVVNAKEGK